MSESQVRYRFAWLWLFLLIAVVLPAQSRRFTLEQAVQYALDHHPDVRNSRLKINEAEQRIIETRAIGIPHLNLTAGDNIFLKKPIVLLPPIFGAGNPNFNPEVSFQQRHNLSAQGQLSALLFNSTYLQGLRAARAFKTFAEEDYQATVKKLTDQVTDAYLAPLLLDANIQVLEKNLENARRMRDETKKIFQAGFVEKLDVDRADLSVFNLEATLDNLKRQYKLSIEALKFAMNYPQDEELVIGQTIDELLAAIPDDLLAANLNLMEHPAYRSLIATEHLNEINVQAAKSAYHPSLTGFANYQLQWQGDNFDDLHYTPSSVAGLQINIPIFQGWGTKAKVEQAKLKLQMLRLTKDHVARSIQFRVQAARIAYDNARERLKQNQKNLQLAEHIYRDAQKRYKNGVGSSLEINQAEMALYRSQQNFIQAKYDLLNAKIKLKQALAK